MSERRSDHLSERTNDRTSDQQHRGDPGALPRSGEDKGYLPAELGDVHQRLLRDGAAWRTGVPDNERLNARVRTLPMERPTSDAAVMRNAAAGPPVRPSGSRGVDADLLAGRELARGDMMHNATIRTVGAWVGGAAALVVVGLLATVLMHMGSGPGGSSTGRVAVQTPTVRPTAVPTQPFHTPADNGWTAFTPTVYSGDVAFAQSSPQRGYLCGQAQTDPDHRLFAVTTDGGQSWHSSFSPAQFPSCSLAVSAANPLDVVVNSYVGSFGSDGPSTYVDSHYSTDGGKTWRAVPIPQGTLPGDGAAWAGSYLYSWVGPSAYASSQQKSSLQVSANGGAFTSIDLSSLLPGAQGLNIQGAVGSSDTVYLNLSYTGCSAQTCQAIVASSDGGQHWTQIPNQSTIALVAVLGNTLYGHAPDAQNSQDPGEWTSTDGGASWTQMNLPPLPGGLNWPTPYCLPTPDGTLIGGAEGYVAYLRSGTWTVLPVASNMSGVRVAVALDAGGKPKALWAIDDGNDSSAGIYWRAVS